MRKMKLRHMVPLQEKAKVCISHPPSGVCTSLERKDRNTRLTLLTLGCSGLLWPVQLPFPFQKTGLA